MKKLITSVIVMMTMATATATAAEKPIDRKALVSRNNPVVTSVDTLASLSVGNGGFAFTTDVTGLQTFPEYYRNGVPLGTQSEWGWHSFDNPEQYRLEESYVMYDFGHGHRELYATQPKSGRAKGAADWYRMNPHRLHLGCIGLEMDGLKPADIRKPRQTLDMWTGTISSQFTAHGSQFTVKTVCHPERDLISSRITGKGAAINLRFPYPTGGHSDDACDWLSNDKHQTKLVSQTSHSALLKRAIDQTVYYVSLSWEEDATLKEKARNYWVLESKDNQLTFCCEFLESGKELAKESFATVADKSAAYWQRFWTEGAAVDFSHCKDPRAKELERRVVLSQWLLAIQCAASTPPQETGLTYNSWFGKFHMEMIWWHQTWLPLWGHGDLLDRTLRWYETVEPRAREIAMRQGFKGVRWMKMTDRSGEEAPSKVGSFLIWQQPHLIYLAELLYRANPDRAILERYGRLIDETAEFMGDFATYDKANDRYILKGMIPAQETLKAAETYNSPFELSYWHFALQIAQAWRERRGLERVALWDDIIQKLAPLAKDSEDRYLAAESAPDTYKTLALISDHPAVLGAVGIFPMSRLVDPDIMKQTQEWIWDNWNWDHTWGWDYPMVAMNATRLGVPEFATPHSDRWSENAVSALLMDKRTNTYLPNGHNYQDQRLRCYLPGNGGLLTAIALMCAGWDGCTERNPGFPKNGRWDVRWEGLKPLPGDTPRQLAFPGAEGFGRFTTGGRGGKVYHVTTLDDSLESGTLRWANEQQGPKTIVFDVSGTIFLKSPLRFTPRTTVAGQTAPGDGICIADYPVMVGSNNIIRYVRFRLGNREVAHHEGDGLGGSKGHDIIVDHCSISWSIDECLSVYGNRNSTVQWCIVSQSLNNAGHQKGAHGYGGNWGGSGASYHHNLMAHHTSRTPRLGPSPFTQADERMDLRNNVIYNWTANGCYGGEAMTVNIVNNYYKPGPGTPTDERGRRIAAPNIRTSEYTHHDSHRPNVWDKMWHVWGKYYVSGNVNTRYPEVTQDNWTYGVYNQINPEANDGTYTAVTKDTIRLTKPMPYEPVTTQTAEEAYELVLAQAGASLHRDALDAAIVRDVREGKATYTGEGCDPGIINTQYDVDATHPWPALKSKPAPKDTDGDGMPDEWERRHGLNPNDAADGNATASDGYTNLEHYLNDIVYAKNNR